MYFIHNCSSQAVLGWIIVIMDPGPALLIGPAQSLYPHIHWNKSLKHGLYGVHIDLVVMGGKLLNKTWPALIAYAYQ